MPLSIYDKLYFQYNKIKCILAAVIYNFESQLGSCTNIFLFLIIITIGILQLSLRKLTTFNNAIYQCQQFRIYKRDGGITQVMKCHFFND